MTLNKSKQSSNLSVGRYFVNISAGFSAVSIFFKDITPYDILSPMKCHCNMLGPASSSEVPSINHIQVPFQLPFCLKENRKKKKEQKTQLEQLKILVWFYIYNYGLN
jgi:hypothetical protein